MCLPANPLDVVIHLHRQFITSAAAAAAQNFTPVGGGHAFAEAVNANTAANLGLVSTLGSHSFVTSLESDDNKKPAVQLLERQAIIT
jgi:3-phosphoglycerate kinase